MKIPLANSTVENLQRMACTYTCLFCQEYSESSKRNYIILRDIRIVVEWDKHTI